MQHTNNGSSSLQLRPEALLPADMLQAISQLDTSCFTCAQLHKMADQIAALRHLGARLKALKASAKLCSIPSQDAAQKLLEAGRQPATKRPPGRPPGSKNLVKKPRQAKSSKQQSKKNESADQQAESELLGANAVAGQNSQAHVTEADNGGQSAAKARQRSNAKAAPEEEEDEGACTSEDSAEDEEGGIQYDDVSSNKSNNDKDDDGDSIQEDASPPDPRAHSSAPGTNGALSISRLKASQRAAVN